MTKEQLETLRDFLEFSESSFTDFLDETVDNPELVASEIIEALNAAIAEAQ